MSFHCYNYLYHAVLFMFIQVKKCIISFLSRALRHGENQILHFFKQNTFFETEIDIVGLTLSLSMKIFNK